MVFAATTVLAIVVATFSFRFIESPILRFGRRFGSNSHTDAAARLGKIVASGRRLDNPAQSELRAQPAPTSAQMQLESEANHEQRD